MYALFTENEVITCIHFKLVSYNSFFRPMVLLFYFVNTNEK